MAGKTFTLNTPLKQDDNTPIPTLTLNEPTAGNLEDAERTSKTNNGRNIALIASCAGIHPAIARNLTATDFTILVEYLDSFFVTDQTTG